ncbi:putative transcription factor B3-Domain family [Medicago truncatula]|uniref:Putative transcription factor B3-Domain family n=1 Tax=Medicago truncatula TaxID=3880 RepID=A0A396H279_MEDTR|nr:putative transcription factor B3-Domain family [Medicago truncatula]
MLICIWLIFLQPFPKNVSEKLIMNDHSSLTLVDEETETLYECAIVTDPRDENLRYIGDGWFEYIASKKFAVGSSLIFIYTIESRMLYVTLIERT